MLMKFMEFFFFFFLFSNLTQPLCHLAFKLMLLPLCLQGLTNPVCLTAWQFQARSLRRVYHFSYYDYYDYARSIRAGKTNSLDFRSGLRLLWFRFHVALQSHSLAGCSFLSTSQLIRKRKRMKI